MKARLEARNKSIRQEIRSRVKRGEDYEVVVLDVAKKHYLSFQTVVYIERDPEYGKGRDATPNNTTCV